jgi:hypothetical protein
MRLIQLPLIAAAIAFGTLPASTEAPDPKDAAALNACLAALDKGSAGQEIYESKSLLNVANPCMDGDPTPVSDPKQIDCLDR